MNRRQFVQVALGLVALTDAALAAAALIGVASPGQRYSFTGSCDATPSGDFVVKASVRNDGLRTMHATTVSVAFGESVPGRAFAAWSLPLEDDKWILPWGSADVEGRLDRATIATALDQQDDQGDPRLADLRRGLASGPCRLVHL